MLRVGRPAQAGPVDFGRVQRGLSQLLAGAGRLWLAQLVTATTSVTPPPVHRRHGLTSGYVELPDGARLLLGRVAPRKSALELEHVNGQQHEPLRWAFSSKAGQHAIGHRVACAVAPALQRNCIN